MNSSQQSARQHSEYGDEDSLESSASLPRRRDGSDNAPPSPRAKAAALRAAEAQTFIGAVSKKLLIGVHDLASVEALSALTAAEERRAIKAAVKAAEASRARELAQTDEDTRPLFAVVETEKEHDTMIAARTLGSPRGRGEHPADAPRTWRSVDVGLGNLPPYNTGMVPLLDRSASFEFQGGEWTGFGCPAYYSEKSKEFVDPYDVQSDEFSGWRVPSPFHGGGVVRFHATFGPRGDSKQQLLRKRLEHTTARRIKGGRRSGSSSLGTDPQAVGYGSLDSSLASLEYTSSAASLASSSHKALPQKLGKTSPNDRISGGNWELQGGSSLLDGVSGVPSVVEGQSLNTPLVGTGDAPSRRNVANPKNAGALVTTDAGVHEVGSEMTGSLGRGTMRSALVVDAHAAPMAWFPGSDDEHRSRVGWHRDHSTTDDMEEEGRSLTASTLSRGEALASRRKRAAKKAYQRAEQERQARAAAKATSGVGSRQETERLEKIDAELAVLAKKRDVAQSKQRAGVAARQAAAKAASERVDAVRAQRKAMVASGALDAPNRPFQGQHVHHALPLGTPFAYRAKDLFKTFQDDEIC